MIFWLSNICFSSFSPNEIDTLPRFPLDHFGECFFVSGLDSLPYFICVSSLAAFCDIDFSFDPALALPPAQVTATCLGATKVDGTVAAASKLSPNAGSQKATGMPTNFQRQLQAAQDRYALRVQKLLAKP